MIENGDNLPLTKKILVDPEYILELVDDLERNLPSELEEAEEILTKRQEILQSADKRAEEEIEKIISEIEVVKEAEKEASQIVTEAKKVANEIKAGVNEYADELLAGLEDDLKRKTSEIQKNRAQLNPKENFKKTS